MRATAKRSATEGGLIGIESDGVVGWARNPANPETPVLVRLMAGNQLLAETVANQFDDARIRTLAGPGVGGFVTRLAAAPACAYPFPLTLHDATGAALGAPLPVQASTDLAPLIGLEPADTYEGHIDGVYDGALKGWARDTADADRAVDLELLDTGRPVATATAHLLREDLRAAGLHRGLYGFSFDLPLSLLDGRAHSLTVRIAGTRILLRGGPVSFGPLATSALLSQMGALQSEVATLRAQIDGLIAPDGIVQRRMLRILSERAAAQADILREQTDRDMEALRTIVFASAARAAEHSQTPETYVPKPRPRRG